MPWSNKVCQCDGPLIEPINCPKGYSWSSEGRVCLLAKLTTPLQTLTKQSTTPELPHTPKPSRGTNGRKNVCQLI